MPGTALADLQGWPQRGQVILALLSLSLTAALFIGYYEKMEDAYPEKVFFI
ncbi:hypothetical protein [Pseudomonas xanthosomatis]|uniref:hypothetical protein n=1 Tax=Pseudomonas xanthosomatis TaxID=2842356 RepID=UPI003461C8A6